MAEVPLANNFILNAEGMPPLVHDPDRVRKLLDGLLSGKFDPQMNAETRLVLMQWLSGGATVALNCRFTPDGLLDVRKNWLFLDNCTDVRLLSGPEMFSASVEILNDDLLDAPLPDEHESSVVKKVADWFRGIRSK